MKKFLLIFIVTALTIFLLGCAENKASAPVITEYTVHYYLEGSTEKLADDKVVTGMAVDTQITENALPIHDYTVVGSENQHLTLAETNNIITFSYEHDITVAQMENGHTKDVINITTDEIDNFLNMTKKEVLNHFGEEYEIVRAGAEGAYDGYFYEEQGLTFIFFPDGLTLEMLFGSDIVVNAIGPNHVEITMGDGNNFKFYWPSEDTVRSVFVSDNVEIRSVRQGMNFAQIQKYLGTTEIVETWIEDPNNTAYKIKYQIGKGWYNFYSFESDGADSSLEITRITPVFDNESGISDD